MPRFPLPPPAIPGLSCPHPRPACRHPCPVVALPSTRCMTRLPSMCHIICQGSLCTTESLPPPALQGACCGGPLRPCRRCRVQSLLLYKNLKWASMLIHHALASLSRRPPFPGCRAPSSPRMPPSLPRRRPFIHTLHVALPSMCHILRQGSLRAAESLPHPHREEFVAAGRSNLADVVASNGGWISLDWSSIDDGCAAFIGWGPP